MHTDLQLVFVADVAHVLVYQVQGGRKVSGPEHLQLQHGPERDSDHKEGFFQKGAAPGAFFDPHTAFKDLEYQQSARALVRHLHALGERQGSSPYEAFVVVGGPKLIGHFRKAHHKPSHVRTRTVVKNLLNHHDLNHIKQVLPALLKEAGAH